VENGDLANAVATLKKQPGKDIMAYGGATFVRSLISLDLVDEYYIFRRPVAIGSGLPVFNDRKVLELQSSVTYKNGVLLNQYIPARVQ
jgi:dihydrofolate reductase